MNGALRRAAEGPLRGILAYSDEELVSVDFNGSTYAAVLDATCTTVVDGTLVKVLAWYDNEYGYSARVADLVVFLRKFL